MCFAVMRSNAKKQEHGGELSLLREQAKECVGIFGCNGYLVFSDQPKALAPGAHACVLKDFAAQRHVPGALTATWVNTAAFLAAWDTILADGRYKMNDWTVKVDPDAVFLPERLKKHLQEKGYPGNVAEGVYIRNCPSGPRGLQLFGSIEVVSKNAVLKYAATKDRCRNEVDHTLVGEDYWLQKCLDLIGVTPETDPAILSDGYCSQSVPDCNAGSAAFHPFKIPLAWFECYHKANHDEAPTKA